MPNLLAGPLDLTVVPHDVKMVFHFDAEAFKQTELGAFFHERMERDNAKEMADVIERAGFDFRSDFSGLTLYADSANREGGQGVMVVTGSFDLDKLMALAAENETYGSSAYGRETVHFWNDNDKDVYSYLGRDGKHMFLADSEKQLYRAIDTLLKQKPSLQQDNPNKLPLDKADQGFLFAGAAGFAKMKGLKAQAAILKSARSAAFLVGEDGGALNGLLAVRALDSDTADTMQDLAEGLIAFGHSKMSKDPFMKQILDAMKTEVTDDRIQVSFQHGAAELLAKMEEMEAAKSDKEAAGNK